ncbi:Clavaminate synthase-like protein [Mollisia scopiformis]|uniref:Clavaminate synthase-like protein n=1 Tax=Mollisia scopiformis TaxID=149040 RepID=A0A132B7N1_MOLSC|nr:Clavaminate synthase-like protein [Mollisia scopiformis]KUJ08410.1 Clavaminate synthase-like protein [Mollisia scopiformis]
MSTTTTVLDENYWCGNNKINGNFGTNTVSSEDSIVGDFDTIPLIDVAGIFNPDISERKKVAAQLYDACTRVGFFYIENHGISQDLVNAVFDCGKEFFALSFDEKMEIYINNMPNYRGYTPLGGSGSSGPDGQGNANEAFDWGHDAKLNDDPNDEFIDTHMRGDNPWPRQLPHFEAVLSGYYRTLRAFARILARNVALSLDLDESYFEPVLTHPGCSALVAHYPPQKSGSRIFG